MATATGKTHCVTCGKGKIAYKCEGCSQYFCLIHLPDHHQAFSKELDEIEDKSKLFRETLIEQRKNPHKHSLIQQINQWEEDSIHKIQQRAEEARQVLLKHTDENINEIEIKLTSLTKELEQIREENDFNEIDLNEFKQKLEQLEEQLSKPSNISIRQDSSSFINKISVLTTSGSLISGTSSANTTTTTTGSNHEDDSYEPNVSFKQIVQLSTVEVKTGEEDENVLFCERGKLYRFDGETNQMKERGIGEMKILQHKTTKLCRILMRREQVLKLCADHQITSQMELKPNSGAENAYLWSAVDFADGEAKYETLCIKFKSSDAAKEFVKQFNDAKQANANAQH